MDTDLFWRRDGTSFPVAYTSTPLRDEEGHIIGTVLSFRDISECKRAQDTLVAEARFLRAQTDVARVAMSSLQPEVLMPSLLEAISHTQGYAFGLFWRVLEAEQTVTVEATFGAGTAPFQSLCFNVNDGDLLTAQAIRTRQPAFCNHLQQSHFATQRISQARGTKALLVLPLIDRTGKVIGALSFGDSEDPERFTERDLTQGMVLAGQVAQAMENSELFRRVQQLEAQYRVVTESLNDAVYTTDHEGRITFGNAALECLTGYRRDVLLGLPSPGLYSVDDQPVLQERRREVFKGAALPPVEVEVLCSDGRRVACELSGTPLLGDGQIIGGVGVLRDITARNQAAQEAERRRQEAEVLAELARSVSASLDLDTVLMRVTEGARTVCRSDAASLALRDPYSEAMLLRYWNGARWPEGEALRVEPGQGVGGQVLLTGRPFRTDHYTEDSRISPNFRQVAFLRGLAAVMAVPIWIGGRMEGILYVANCAPQPFTDHDEAILQRLADQAAIAMQNARLYQQQAQRQTELRTLLEINKQIGQTRALAPLLSTIAQEAARLLDVPVALVRQREGDDLVLASFWGEAIEMTLRPRLKIGEHVE
ncbi:MAG: GAF domain-containing protein, partial [Nitrospinae bacterium]|nr:GAF domain-containing protein [Nitrospinota bacterium]